MLIYNFMLYNADKTQKIKQARNYHRPPSSLRPCLDTKFLEHTMVLENTMVFDVNKSVRSSERFW